MKKVVQLIIVFLLAVFQGAALEPAQVQPFSKSVHNTQRNVLKNPVKSVSILTSQPDFLISVDDLSSTFSFKDSSKDGWSSITTYDRLLTAKRFQYLNYSKWLVIDFDAKAIIFPFHYHW